MPLELHTNSDNDRDGYSNAHTNSNQHTTTDCNGNPDVYASKHIDADPARNSYQNAYRYADFHSHTEGCVG